jgi:hypothetical protein
VPIKLESIQLLFTKRNARARGPISSENVNDTNDELSNDLLALNSQWNTRLVPMTATIPDGTVDSDVNAFSTGLQGKTLFVSSSATSVSESKYFNSTKSRPRTVFEQFENVYTTVDTFKEFISNQMKTTLITAADVPISDVGGLFAATNVESALQEVMTDVAAISFSFDFTALTSSLIPDTDIAYDIGSSLLRWRDAYFGPASVNIIATAAEAGGVSKAYALGVNASGHMTVAEGGTGIAKFRSTGELEVATTLIEEAVAAPSAIAGFGSLYVLASDGGLYFKDSSGTIIPIGNTTTSNILTLSADSDNNQAGSSVDFVVDGTIMWRVHNDSSLVSVDSSAVVLTQNGDATNPGYGFSGSTNYGIFRGSTPNRLGFSIAGTETMSLRSDSLWVSPSASGMTTAAVAADNLIVESSGDTGLTIASPDANTGQIDFSDASGNSRGSIVYDHTADSLALHTAGAVKWTLPSTGHITASADYAVLAGNGLVGAPSFGFKDNPTTGLYYSSGIRMTVGGALKYSFTSAGISSAAIGFSLRNTTTSATVPTYAFGSDTATGLGMASAGAFDLIASGVNVGSVNQDQIKLKSADLVARPALAFGDGDSGFYEAADDKLHVSVAGSTSFYWQGLLFASTTAGGPSLRNVASTSTVPGLLPDSSDINTGIGSSGDDQLSLIAGGVQMARLTTTSLEVFGNIVSDTMQARCSAYYTVANTTALTSAMIGFDTGTNGGTVVETISSNGITYASDGTFTVAEPGTYLITASLYLTHGTSNQLATLSLEGDTAAVFWSASPDLTASVIENVNISIMIELVASEAVFLNLDGNSTDSLTIEIGSAMTIQRIA